MTPYTQPIPTSGTYTFTVKLVTRNGQILIGVANPNIHTSGYLGTNSNGWSYYSGGNKVHSGGTPSYGQSSWSTGEIFKCIINRDEGSLSYFHGETDYGEAFREEALKAEGLCFGVSMDTREE